MFLRLRFYSRLITRTIFSIKILFRVQVFQGSGFSGSRFFRTQVFQDPGPGFRSSQDKQVYVTTKKLSEETEQNPSEPHSLVVLVKGYL